MINKFEVGDVVMLGKYRVRILSREQDGVGAWWYVIKYIDVASTFRLFLQEVPESALIAF